jgi:hypothetical protein
VRSIFILAVLVGWVCTACVSTSTRYAGYYDRTQHVYVNDKVGFQLTFRPRWFVTTTPGNFSVPLALRPDQEQVLEAYDPITRLGLVIIVQQGPLLTIDELVQRMQAMPEAQVSQNLSNPQATDVRQHTIRHIVVNGYDTAEWIYTATDTTAGLPVDITVSTYILQAREQYVYLTFSTPTVQDATSRPAIEAILHTFASPPARVNHIPEHIPEALPRSPA